MEVSIKNVSFVIVSLSGANLCLIRKGGTWELHYIDMPQTSLEDLGNSLHPSQSKVKSEIKWNKINQNIICDTKYWQYSDHNIVCVMISHWTHSILSTRCHYGVTMLYSYVDIWRYAT